MISLARKNLLNEKLRFFISVGGVAFAVLLIIIILALYRGWNNKLGRYVEGVSADAWVLQKGAADMFHSTSLFPESFLDALKDVDGVQGVDPVIGRRVPIEGYQKEAMIILMGYDTKTGAAGPLEIVSGRTPKRGEIVIDEVLSDKIDRKIGDTLDIVDKEFVISGISRGGNVVTFQYSFIPIEDAQEEMQMTGLVNYALVTFQKGANPKAVEDRIEKQFPNLHVLTKSTFADNNRRQIMEAFLPIIQVLVVIGFIVGLVVISLTIYTATLEKSREYGMLKAIGAKNRHLYRIIFTQSAIAGIVGFVLGVILTFIAADVVARLEPSFVTSISWQDIVWVFVMTIIMILLSAFIPIRRILQIDPAIVFKT